ncbi:MAG: nicotinamide mononucleotide transporter [Pelagibacterales bacterium]|nr:nicotinamide mononucleotide transporter [Pelagibacterales bacterium]|tara:strand:- start:5713 stop:6339 length:627 start_codon:yes stop_codon:yes gene_type:complete
MDQIFDLLFSQYSSYSDTFIFLELIAVITNIISVIFAKQNNILVYPTGLIGTGIFVFILFNFDLFGDMIVNGYFFLVSIYGWYFWSRKKDKVLINNISELENKDYNNLIFLFLLSLISIYFIYVQFDKWNNWTAYIDCITTAIFFVAMWLMAKRKVESWIFWIIGDIITVPLYFYKGLTISSIQYIIFTGLAILGYISWKKILFKNNH